MTRVICHAHTAPTATTRAGVLAAQPPRIDLSALTDTPLRVAVKKKKKSGSMGVVLQIVCLVFALLGLITLSAFLLTVVLSDEVRRHPVFLNFICTWVIWSLFMAFSGLGAIAMPDYARSETSVVMHDAMRDILWLVTQVATLNLVIHLWYTMNTFLRDGYSIRADKRRSLILLVTPYLAGLLPVAELFYRPGIIFGIPTRVSLKPLFLALTIATLIFDVALLYIFCKNRQRSQHAEIRGVMSTVLLTKLLICSLFRVLLMILCVLFIIDTNNEVSDMLFEFCESLNPLLVFLLLGTKRDALRVWFCRRSGQATSPSDTCDPELGTRSLVLGVSSSGTVWTGDTAATIVNISPTSRLHGDPSGGIEGILPPSPSRPIILDARH